MSETLPTFASRIAYKDLRAAVEWLQKAFGFKPAFATDKTTAFIGGMASIQYLSATKSK